MKFLFQSTLARPQDWSSHDDAREWLALPKRHPPVAGDKADNGHGWCHGINVQGVLFSADHYHLAPILGGVRVKTWDDDPIDYPPGERQARVWDILDLAPDPLLRDAINTRQTQVVYAEPVRLARLMASGPMQNTTFRPWSRFVQPNAFEVMHGIQCSDEHHKAHLDTRAAKGWRDFTDGLHPSELDDRGCVKCQRDQGRFSRPNGTITYFGRDTTATTAHVGVEHELDLLKTTATAGNVQATINASSDEYSYVFTTGPNEPNDATWPTGNYRCQLDCTSVGVSISYGLLTLGGTAGHFARTDFIPFADTETKAQAESAFTGTGLKLATTGSVSWSSGNANDRFECAVAAANSDAMESETITLQLNETDDFADGPWGDPVSNTVTSQAEVAGIAQANTSQAESTGPATRTVTAQSETLQGLTQTNTAQAESQSSPVGVNTAQAESQGPAAATSTSQVESLGTVTDTITAQVEALQGVTDTNTVQAEAAGPASATATSQAEALQLVTGVNTEQAESKAFVSGPSTAQAETLQALSQSSTAQVESAGPVDNTMTAQAEALSSLAGTVTAQAESIGSVTSSVTMQVGSRRLFPLTGGIAPPQAYSVKTEDPESYSGNVKTSGGYSIGLEEVE